MPRAPRPAQRLLAIALLLAAVVVPTRTAAAATATGGGFTTSASASPAEVAPGTSVRLTVRVTASTARSALVDVEVYDGAGQKVYQRFWDAQSFSADITRTFRTSWAVPAGEAAGGYRVDVGIFSNSWGTLYHWNSGATTLSVSTAPPPTTTTATTAPTTSTTTTTTTAPPTTTTVPRSGYFATLPPGSILPSDAECAARVRPAPEVRSMNTPYNETRGVAGLSSDRNFARVTGNFTGTTDEIIQWAACKWGFDEDVVRAQSAVESYWDQRAGGDLTSDSNSCPPGHGIGVDGHPGQCPDSWGLQQVRFTTFRWAFPAATLPPIRSTAYNLDIALAARRNCYEGLEPWLNTVEHGQTYAAGDLWGCVGMWFSGRWYTQPSIDYINVVKDYLARRIWTTPDFLGYH
jgi:autotransporter family porin